MPDGGNADARTGVEGVPPGPVPGAAFRPPTVCSVVVDFVEVRFGGRARIEKRDRNVSMLANGQ